MVATAHHILLVTIRGTAGIEPRLFREVVLPPLVPFSFLNSGDNCPSCQVLGAVRSYEFEVKEEEAGATGKGGGKG